MGILISVITITLLVLCYVRMYNRLKRLFVKVQEGSAGIDVALEKRYDMLSEEIEAVKKYLAHEYQIYTEVTSTRAGKELNESIFQEKKQLSEEAVKAISETIAEQQKQMETIRRQLEQQRGQDHSFGAETPGMGDDGLIGHQVSLDRKLGLLTSAQQGLTGVNSAINALAGNTQPFIPMRPCSISSRIFLMQRNTYKRRDGCTTLTHLCITRELTHFPTCF